MTGRKPLAAWKQPSSPVLPPPFALIEMAALLGLVLLEYLWEGFPAVTRINPHPYWIAVLLLSLQYGTVSGLIAAGLAIIGTVLIGMPEPDIEERYFTYLVRVWTQPVLWLLAALLLGTFRARQIEQKNELLRQAENLRVRGATLLDYANNLRVRCTLLERRLATRDTSETSKLLSALSRLGEAEPGRWAHALADVLAAGFPRSQLSLYAVDGGNARLILTHGRTANDTAAPAEIDARHPLVIAVAGSGRSLSVLDPADDAALAGLGVAAVPVIVHTPQSNSSAKVQRVIGFLKADRLPPGLIDAATTRRLAVIASAIAPAMRLGTLSPVADTGLPEGVAPQIALEDAIPTVRKWRLLKWLPGGRSDPPAEPDGSRG